MAIFDKQFLARRVYVAAVREKPYELVAGRLYHIYSNYYGAVGIMSPNEAQMAMFILNCNEDYRNYNFPSKQADFLFFMFD